MFQLIVRKYLDSSNLRELNYLNFCHDIDKPEDIYKPYVPKKPVNDNSIPTGTLRDAGNTFFEESTVGMDLLQNRF